MAIFDVPEAYLNDDMSKDKSIILNIEGESVDIMCEVNPEHRKNVRMEHVVKLLYLRLLKVLYGCLGYGLLLYDLHGKTLKPQVLVVNPYDR